MPKPLITPPTKGLQKPPFLSPDGERAWKAIVEVLRKARAKPGGRTFYSPAEWEERGEKYATGSQLVVVYDGGDVGRFFEYDWNDYKGIEKMVAALEKIGMYSESGTNWYSGVYFI